MHHSSQYHNVAATWHSHGDARWRPPNTFTSVDVDIHPLLWLGLQHLHPLQTAADTTQPAQYKPFTHLNHTFCSRAVLSNSLKQVPGAVWLQVSMPSSVTWLTRACNKLCRERQWSQMEIRNSDAINARQCAMLVADGCTAHEVRIQMPSVPN